MQRRCVLTAVQEMGCAYDFVSKEHFAAYLDLNTQDYWIVWIDQDPHKRGGERYYKLKAMDDDEVGNFAFGSDVYWGGPRAQMAAKQRKKYKPPIKYARSYLERMMQGTRITQQEMAGNTQCMRDQLHYDFQGLSGDGQ